MLPALATGVNMPIGYALSLLHAKFSSRMVFAISAAVAAPLLGMAQLPSFGIIVHGPGKAGKSTMLLAAASVIGYGREQDLPNFRATDAAFGEIPAAFNDSFLPLNELGLLKGSATEKYHRFRDLTYGLRRAAARRTRNWRRLRRQLCG